MPPSRWKRFESSNTTAFLILILILIPIPAPMALPSVSPLPACPGRATQRRGSPNPSALVAMFAIVLGLLLTNLTLSAQSPPTLRSGKSQLSAEDRQYWAFQPVQRPSIPTVRSPASGAHSEKISDIDAFVLARLEQKGLSPNPPATPRELVRRATFDLIGLPPSPEDVAAFERNPTEAAWAALIDRLLASPHYGERWGRHWLDLVRFAESNGYERDGAKPDAWRYRDYIIDAFNRDKPYDQFVREQLAGDEIADEEMAATRVASPAWREAIIATGFYRLHVWDDEPDSTIKAEFDDLDDIMVTTGTAFLGMTIGCARCHDHKYDPVSQQDYYAMLGFFRSIDPYGRHHTGGGGRGTGRIQRTLASPEEIARWETTKRQRIAQAEKTLAALTPADGEARKRAEAQLKKEREANPPFDQALAITENGPTPKATHLLARGDAFTPREEVSPAFPVVLRLPAPTFPARDAHARTTGRRRVLAAWIASPTNPLTARVMVNRLWQHHFGAGLVPTPDDFGLTGVRPTHPALLDYLAHEFVARGWSVKQIHRLIMTSRAYRMSSRTANARGMEIDEGNELLWRQNLRRVEAEVVRDAMLSISGSLNPKAGGPSVFPTLPREVHGTQDSAGKGWTDSSSEEQNRRSVYLVVKRALKVPLLECLDFANSASPSGTRPNTTIAPQALMLLNDSFVQKQSAALAERLEKEAGPDTDRQIERAFSLAVQRPPTRREMKNARALLADQLARARADHAPLPSRVAWQSFCRAMLNLNEVIYVD
jgi:hypothetical protein